jgi:succinoglycan biosynthesis transport protein ExoP
MHASLSSELQLLRVRIEAFASGPAVIMVTSAQVGDGKSLTAWSLADSLAAAGHDAVLVDANTDAPRTTGATLVRDLRRFPNEDIAQFARPFGPNGLSVISMSQPEVATTSSRQTIRHLTTQLRKKFDFAIVDTGALPKNNIALLLAAAADGVLVSVRTGRAATKEDLVLVRTLQQTNRRILGVVLTSKETIDLFELISKGYDKNIVALAPPSTPPTTQTSRQAMAHSGQ